MKTFKSISLVLLTLLLTTISSFANSSKPPVSAKSKTTEVAEPLKVQFLGEKEGYLYFEVNFEVLPVQTASFSISDINEGELHNTSISETKSQTFKIEKRENQTLEFHLKVKNKNFSKSVTIVPVVVLSRAK